MHWSTLLFQELEVLLKQEAVTLQPALGVIGQAFVGMQHVQWFQFEEQHTDLVKFSVSVYTVSSGINNLLVPVWMQLFNN